MVILSLALFRVLAFWLLLSFRFLLYSFPVQTFTEIIIIDLSRSQHFSSSIYLLFLSQERPLMFISRRVSLCLSVCLSVCLTLSHTHTHTHTHTLSLSLSLALVKVLPIHNYITCKSLPLFTFSLSFFPFLSYSLLCQNLNIFVFLTDPMSIIPSSLYFSFTLDLSRVLHRILPRSLRSNHCNKMPCSHYLLLPSYKELSTSPFPWFSYDTTCTCINFMFPR